MIKLIAIRIKEDFNNQELNFVKEKSRFIKLFENISLPITLAVEHNYNDRDYKDVYYNFFASKYRNYSKFTNRIVVFMGSLSEDELYSIEYNLQERLIASITIKPLNKGSIGKIYLNPKKLNNLNSYYIRLTNLKIGFAGRKLDISTFPFSSQDGEYMTCAETTLWMILQYYGIKYAEYKMALPSEIINIVDNKDVQRVLPSNGLNYMTSSLVLKKFGFASKIYYRIFGNKKTDDTEQDFKRWFHYYIESGIPLLVGIKFDKSNMGHTVACIGHGSINDKNSFKFKKIGNFQVCNSANFINKYVFMDDNKTPFEIKEFDNFNYPKYASNIIKYFIVPLYKKIYLEAGEAEKIFYEILKNKNLGLNNIENIKEKIVLRVFLTTSRNYKVSRFKSSQDLKLRKLYTNVPMPKFVWICEISTPELYKEHKAIGEIILDATASKDDALDTVILIRYQKKIGYKFYNDKFSKLLSRLKNISMITDADVYSMFNENLEEVEINV